MAAFWAPNFTNICALALSLLLGATSLAEARERQVYSVSIRGIGVGNFQISVDETPNSYGARGVVETGGLVGAFVSFRFDGTATGAILSNGRLQPRSYNAFRDSGETPRRITMAYSRGTPTSLTLDPPRRAAPHNLDPTKQGGALDPISAAWTFLREQPAGSTCGKTIRVYDGARLNQFEVQARRQAGDLWACPGRYTRVGGYPPERLAERKVFNFTIFYREVDGMMRPARIEVETTFGKAVARRTS